MLHINLESSGSVFPFVKNEYCKVYIYELARLLEMLSEHKMVLGTCALFGNQR